MCACVSVSVRVRLVWTHPKAPAGQFEVLAVKFQPVLVDLYHSWVGAVNQLETSHVWPQFLELGHVQVHKALQHDTCAH